jgi:hypothetical protein
MIILIARLTGFAPGCRSYVFGYSCAFLDPGTLRYRPQDENDTTLAEFPGQILAGEVEEPARGACAWRMDETNK